jgi:NADPH-dependent curcumin reductase CurA
MIEDYNSNAPSAGPANFAAIIAKRIRLEGFLILDYGGRTMEAMGQMIPWLQEGKLKHEETLVEGDVTDLPKTLNMLFDGENRGKLMLKIADPELEVPGP